MECCSDLRIPLERVAVLIGRKGETKQMIEQECRVKLDVDSEEGVVRIKGEDAISVYNAREFVNAIGRGFNPRVALHLLRGDYVCEVISLRGRSSKSRKFLERMKGRIIGSQGKSRRLMEELSGTNICVYGKTVSIIGLSERVAITRKAIEMLLKGSQHSTVYRWLEKEGCRLRRKQFLGQFGIEEGNI